MSDKDNFHWTPGEPLPVLPLHTISLRDYFAGQAIQGLLSRGEYGSAKGTETAYQIADAMIKSRNKQPPPGE